MSGGLPQTLLPLRVPLDVGGAGLLGPLKTYKITAAIRPGPNVGDYVWAVYCLYAWAVMLVITYGQCTVCMPGR